MNSDLMPSPESSNSIASKQAPINEESTTENVLQPTETVEEPTQNAQPPVEAAKDENSSTVSNTSVNNGNTVNRQQPIPPPSEPMQYRAIGLVRGRYIASQEQFTQGAMVTTDGTQLDAVLLGRIMSLVKNHLDLEQEHLWVVYPRTRQQTDNLHLQIVGVWEPENLAKNQIDQPQPEEQVISNGHAPNLVPSSKIPDGGFSVRGEVVYQSHETSNLVIKIKQAARKPDEKPKYFKLKLKGKLDIKAVARFWDLQVRRDADQLVVESGEVIADLPKKYRRPQRKKPFRGGRKPMPRRGGETQRPIRKTSDSPVAASRPTPSKPTPKPVKRPKPPQ